MQNLAPILSIQQTRRLRGLFAASPAVYFVSEPTQLLEACKYCASVVCVRRFPSVRMGVCILLLPLGAAFKFDSVRGVPSRKH